MEKPRRKVQTYESDPEAEESVEEQPSPPRRRQLQRRKKQQQQGPLDLDGVGQTAGGVVGGVTNTLGNVAGQAVDNNGGKSDTLRLRLDLNLEVEITLKAKIHGDLELALLYVSPFSFLLHYPAAFCPTCLLLCSACPVHFLPFPRTSPPILFSCILFSHQCPQPPSPQPLAHLTCRKSHNQEFLHTCQKDGLMTAHYQPSSVKLESVFNHIELSDSGPRIWRIAWYGWAAGDRLATIPNTPWSPYTPLRQRGKQEVAQGYWHRDWADGEIWPGAALIPVGTFSFLFFFFPILRGRASESALVKQSRAEHLFFFFSFIFPHLLTHATRGG